MFDPSAQRLMEQQFGVSPTFHDNPDHREFQNNGGTTVTTQRTTTQRRSQSSKAPNGSTVIMLGDDEDDRQQRRHTKQMDLNHNVPIQQGYTSSQMVSSTSRGNGSSTLQVPGASSVQVTTTKKTSHRSSSPRRAGRSPRRTQMQMETSRVQTGSPQIHVQSQMSPQEVQQQMSQLQIQKQQMQEQVSQLQMQKEQLQKQMAQQQMPPQQRNFTRQEAVHIESPEAKMHSGSLQANSFGLQSPEIILQSSPNQMNPAMQQSGAQFQQSQMMTPQKSGQPTDEMLHSPGGQSDVSWASLPSAFKGPFSPGKTPIDIQVHSPTWSDTSVDSTGAMRVREVKTEIPQAEFSEGGEAAPKGKKFLKKVQKELEEQRGKWKEDVDKLTGGIVGLGVDRSPNGTGYGTSSFIDTSSGAPIFKATVDMSGYRPEDITVSMDKLVNKAVIQAVQKDHTGFPKKTFTQRVQLPRFADDTRLSTRLSKSGQLKLEVPLIYYFDDMKQEGRKAKSFVYQVNKGKDGEERLEILVNTGSGFRARDLKVQVHDDNRLVIIGEVQGGPKKLIKQYTLPAFANSDGITSRLGKDGRLQVNVPIKRTGTG